jgi:hypothetical protein
MAVDVGVAGDAALEGAQRHQDDVVLVGAEARLPLTASRPMTSQETLLTRMLRPTAGPAPPNSSSRTVSPMMQAARPLRSSPSRNWRPSVRVQSWVTK